MLCMCVWHVSVCKKQGKDVDLCVVFKKCLLLSLLSTTDGHSVGRGRVHRRPTYLAALAHSIQSAHIHYTPPLFYIERYTLSARRSDRRTGITI